MYQRKWKDADAKWENISDKEAQEFAKKYYVDAELVLSSVRDGCDMNTAFAYIRWVPSDKN